MKERDWTNRIAGRGASLLLSAALGLCGCEAFVGSGPAAPYKTEDEPAAIEQAGMSAPAPAQNNTSAASAGGKAAAKPANAGAPAPAPSSNAQGGGSAPATPSMPASPCDTAPQNALATLTTYCSACHSNPATAKAGFSTILDAPALLSSGKVVKDQPQMSAIYKRISTGSMPPSDVKKRPSTSDVSAIEAWISCGAEDWNTAPAKPAAAFVSIDSRLQTVLSDLRSFPNPIDRERMRYFDLSHLSNSGYSDDQLQEMRDAVSMLMNSLSRGRSVVAPVAVDKAKLLYRVDLRDYLWDAASWTQLEAEYPYAVIYDQDSRLFPEDEISAEQIRAETNTQIPVIYGDWFVSHASRPPLYYSLLQLADTLQGLEQQLGVDIQRDIDTEQVERSGFANAGPSQNNRVIERHELGGNRGALWLSYDFSTNLDNKNVFSHPLDFKQDGGEMIFNLENGLQGYFIANFAGTRLDKAPTNVVQDPASRDGAVESGLSCMNCHQVDGQLPKFDEIRDFQLNAGASAKQIEGVLALYVPRDQLQAAFDADQNRYRTARAALGISKLTNSSMHQLDDRHLGLLDLDGVAAVVGLPATEVKRAIDASPQAFPPEIVTLRTQGGGIQRDSFESIVANLFDALGLGRQLRVDAQGRGNQDDQQPNRGGQAQAGAGAGGNAAQAGAGGAAAGSGGAGGSGSSNNNTSSDGRRR